MKQDTSTILFVGLLSATSLDSIGAIRLIQDVDAALQSDWIWIRCPISPAKPQIQNTILHLPWQERYQLIDNVLLRPLDSRLPSRRLPSLNWQTLTSLFVPSLPHVIEPGLFAGLLPPPIDSTSTSSPDLGSAKAPQQALLLSSAEWLNYVNSAPEIRLKPLTFALSEKDMALVKGHPLPPLRGEFYYYLDRVLWPLGCTPASLLFSWPDYLQLKPNETALIHPNGSFQVIPDSGWIPASRGAVRLSIHPETFA